MKILFVHSCMPTFAKTEFDILSKVHNVREFNFPSPHHGWIQVLKCLPALWRGVQWADLTFSFFGKLHAFFGVFFSRIFGKKSAVVLSGGEVCRFSYGDGRYRSLCSQPIKRWFPRYIVRRADLLLPVSDYVYEEAIASVGAYPQRMKMIYHGFDTTLFCRRSEIEKQPIALTVAELNDDNLCHKGLLEIIKAAKYSPDTTFVLVGAERDNTAATLLAQSPKNTVMTGGLFGYDLIKQMNQAAVYIQASVWESFGCAVAEAMACECVPVVTRIPALEEVVGDCGVYLDDPITPKEIAAKVQEALKHPELGRRARQRIIEKFHIENREKELLDAVNSISVR